MLRSIVSIELLPNNRPLIKGINEMALIDKSFENVYQSIANFIRQARSNIVKSVNSQQVIAYWQIGKNIVEQEQFGESRADYGKALLENLSKRLNDEFGNGFGVTNLKYMRQFYLTYQNRIGHKPCDESSMPEFNPNLSWSHYRIIMRESRQEARSFYEIEAANNHWSVPQLQRQMGSFLFDRLSASQNKESVLALANEGQIIRTPEDTLKDPVILEFLGYLVIKNTIPILRII
jgi:hypothetical protein